MVEVSLPIKAGTYFVLESINNLVVLSNRIANKSTSLGGLIFLAQTLEYAL